jgi:hypothetical protein
VTLDEAGTQRNAADVRAATSDPDAANNTAEASTDVAEETPSPASTLAPGTEHLLKSTVLGRPSGPLPFSSPKTPSHGPNHG